VLRELLEEAAGQKVFGKCIICKADVGFSWVSSSCMILIAESGQLMTEVFHAGDKELAEEC